jgi:hypothetical protein
MIYKSWAIKTVAHPKHIEPLTLSFCHFRCEIQLKMLSTKSVDKLVINSSQCRITFCKLWGLVKLTKNWPDLIQSNIQSPETVAEAVDRLMIVLDDGHKTVIAAMQEDDLVDLHFGLGLAIRNAFGLHEPNSKLLASCGVVHPDDAAGTIIQVLWRTLQP